MAYTTPDRVFLMLSIILKNRANKSVGEIDSDALRDDIIPEMDAVIDATLRQRGYPTTITDTSDLALLRRISTLLAAQEVANITEPVGPAVAIAPEFQRDKGKWGNEADDLLMQIRMGTIQLNTARASRILPGIFDKPGRRKTLREPIRWNRSF